jgi:hypothetical protein
MRPATDVVLMLWLLTAGMNDAAAYGRLLMVANAHPGFNVRTPAPLTVKGVHVVPLNDDVV